MALFTADCLDGEVAVVTGASRGIGKAIAAALSAAGATVIGTATTEGGASAIAERLGEPHRGEVLDVADAESIAAFVATLSATPPSVLVNNAGITKDNLLLRMKDDEWDNVVETNLSGLFRLTKALLRGMMKQRRGRIITISSVVGVMGNPGQANYAAAKAGAIGFTKSLAREVGSRGITANVVAPGFIATDMTEALGEEQAERLKSQVALARLGDPDDVAAAVVYLASAAGGYVTGETLHVNGGLWMV